MKKLLLSFLSITVILFSATGQLHAETSKVVMTTDAAKGELLRIWIDPGEMQDVVVEGATKGKFAGEYYSAGAGSQITVSNTKLTELEVYNCSLTSLDVSCAPELSILKCYNNQIANLNVGGCNKLSVIDCHDNRLQSLDLSKCNILQTVSAANNNLTSLSLGDQPILETLDCSNNSNLDNLDVSKCPGLNDLSFHDCKLNNINLSQNDKLSWVYAYNNGIAGDKMAEFISNMPEGFNSQIFIVDTFADSESNVCTMENVRAFAMKSWVTMDYIGGGGGETQLGKFYPGCDYVPAVSESKITFTTSRAAGEKVTLYISSEKSLIIEGVKEPVATGKNTYTLTASTVTISGDVAAFECPGNDITSLTFVEPTLLSRLECQNNHITKLDLTGAKALTQLLAENNNISSLNVSGCNALLRVNCFQNNLHGPKMTAFVNSLCTSTEDPLLFIIDTKASDEHNVATTTQVDIAKGKGWSVYDYNGGANYGFGVAYKGSEPGEEELPDEFFTFTRSALGELSFNVKFCKEEYNNESTLPTVEGAKILGWNGEGLMLDMTEETVTIYGDIKTIDLIWVELEEIDVTNLPNLTELNISLNDIKQIDLSKNTKLQMFSCECNLLEALDFSANKELYYVNCYGNKIQGEAMTKMMTSLPQRDKVNHGSIIVRDVTYTQNANVCLKSDVYIALAKCWATFEIVNDTELIQYWGEEPSGIESISTATNSLQYDSASSMVLAGKPSTIEVFTLSGIRQARAENSCELSIGDLASGIYIARSGNQTIKIVK